MKTKKILFFYLAIMFLMPVYGLLFPAEFRALLEKPQFYIHAKFIHILSVTLFFANAVIGSIWETRSLLSKRAEIIRYTYENVVWLDAVFTAPLILISVVSGIMLGTILGGVWTIGWLSVAFSLFILSGVFWLAFDIPTQYRIKKLFRNLEPGATTLPPELVRLLWLRMGISFLDTAPLLVIFYLMVNKPQMPVIASWFHI